MKMRSHLLLPLCNIFNKSILCVFVLLLLNCKLNITIKNSNWKRTSQSRSTTFYWLRKKDSQTLFFINTRNVSFWRRSDVSASSSVKSLSQVKSKNLKQKIRNRTRLYRSTIKLYYLFKLYFEAKWSRSTTRDVGPRPTLRNSK